MSEIAGLAPGLVVVLAAGGGTRMKSDTPKVLHQILGRPLLGHVLQTAVETRAQRVAVVVGHQRELVEDYLSADWPGVEITVQADQNGTGHAVRCAVEQLAQAAPLPDGPVVVINGDTPLLTPETLRALVAAHMDTASAVTVLSAEVPNATGYGRIIRDDAGQVLEIVEQKDASPEQCTIREINSGMYAFDRDVLLRTLAELSTDNAQGEEYLTQVLSLARGYGENVSAFIAADTDEVHGINDRVQLAEVAAMLADRINKAHMRAGVTIIDPATTWIGRSVDLGRDCIVERNTFISDGCVVGPRATIGPDTTMIKALVAEGARVVRSHIEQAQVGPHACVGPFTFLRPGTVLAAHAKAGAYVEIKKSTIGEGSKVPHLSYVGDATIGRGSNIGAATIFANYDGVNKHPITIGDEVRIGSDTVLVAPVQVGDGAYTAAGSTITDDVPAGSIGVARGRQRNILDWVKRRRPGTGSARAAENSQQTPGAQSD